MSLSRRHILTGTALLLLGGCGFRPMLAANSGAGPALAQTRILMPPGRLGQQIWKEITARANPRGRPEKPVYELALQLKTRKEGLAIRQDETVTRFNLLLDADYTLYRLSDRKALLKGRLRSVSSYNVVVSEYANLAAEQDAENRAARQLALDLVDRLASYFQKN